MKKLVNIVEMLNLSTDEIERTGGATLGLCSSRDQIKDAVVQALIDIELTALKSMTIGIMSLLSVSMILKFILTKILTL
jgi:hypothetical protein